jgi:hypothetical protein
MSIIQTLVEALARQGCSAANSAAEWILAGHLGTERLPHPFLGSIERFAV